MMEKLDIVLDTDSNSSYGMGAGRQWREIVPIVSTGILKLVRQMALPLLTFHQHSPNY